MLKDLYMPPRTGYFVFIAALLLVPLMRASGEKLDNPKSCTNPKSLEKLEDIFHCVDSKDVTVISIYDKKRSGKFSPINRDACFSEDGCDVNISRWYGKSKVNTNNIAVIKFRPPASKQRRVVAWTGGIAVGVGVTAFLLSEGAGEGIGIFALAPGAFLGTNTGLILGRSRKVSVAIIR